jgi:V8-like Glu-specific endopeptidase
MKKQLSLLIGLFFVTTAFAFEPEKIIGQNDLVLVNAEATNVPVKFRSVVDAFGIMSMGCTATHIGQGYVLTAGHCFRANEIPMQNKSCTGVSIRWGHRSGRSAYMVSNCETIVAAQRNNTENDFAIIKVSPVPRVSIEVDLRRKALSGDSITIFSHPLEEELQWSKNCTVESILDPMLPQQALHHKCDTNPGSSGATIINSVTGKIVGIHDGGRLTSPGMGMNYGTYMTSINLRRALWDLGYR